MLKKRLPEEFKVFFLLQFTRELIRHSITTEIESEVEQKEEKDTLKEKVKEVLKKESSAKKHELSEDSIKMNFQPSIMDTNYPAHAIPVRPRRQIRKPLTPKKKLLIPARRAPVNPMQKSAAVQKPVFRPLKIPEPQLPQRLQYLRPTPTNKEIDLGKLNPLIKDPAVRTIQCDGADSNIVVIGTMGIKSTSIILTRDEVDDIIGRFSMATKIPLQDEGVFKIVFGKLILSAIISKVIGPRFIIKKMSHSQMFAQRPFHNQGQVPDINQIFPRK